MQPGNFSARLLIFLLPLGIGMAVLLFLSFVPSHQARWVQRAEASCIRAIFPSKSRVTDYDEATKTITVQAIDTQSSAHPPLHIIEITDDPDRIFEACPPTALDYAVILEKLYEQGYRNIALTTRMTWDAPTHSEQDQQATEDPLDDCSLMTQALSGKLARFDQSVIGLPVTRGAQSQSPPTALLRALISRDQIQGNPHLIPRVNQVALPSSISPGLHTSAGFHSIESAPASRGTIPLLAHWSHRQTGKTNSEGIGEEIDGFIPSIELLMIMNAYGISPSELKVQLGSHIRLGSTGPIIPIDDFGQTSASKTTSIHAPSTSIHAEDLIALKTTATQRINHSDKNALSPLCIIHATGTKTSVTNVLSADRFTEFQQLYYSLPTLQNARDYRKLGLGFEILLIIAIAALLSGVTGLGCLMNLPSITRNLAPLLIIPLLILTQLAVMVFTQSWFGLAAPMITALSCLGAWTLTTQLKKSTILPEPPEHSDSSENSN